jgi:hypothetical protein
MLREEIVNKENLLKIILILGMLCSAPMIASAEVQKNRHEFTDAVTVSHRHSFKLNLPPQEAIQLFTAKGEIPWIPVWNPAILRGDGYKKGSIFVGAPGKNSTYITIDYNQKLSTRSMRE